MITNFKTFFLIPILMLMMHSSCQEEVIETSSYPTSEVLVYDSELVNLMLLTSYSDGSFDNILDRANCTSIKLPVTAYANNLEIEINSIEDYTTVETVFNQFEDDVDTISIVGFPITLTLSDYSEITIQSQYALQNFIAECNGENEIDDDIECIDFKYPVSFSSFNIDFQTTKTVSVESDRELFEYIKDMSSPELITSLNFPITMVLYDGTEIEVNNAPTLTNVINQAKNTCNEDDDFDYDDDDFTKQELDLLLSSCSWSVKSMSNSIEVNDFMNYYFETDADLTYSTENQGSYDYSYGVWSTTITDDGAVLTINSQTVQTWVVTDLENETIKWTASNGAYLILEKNCEFDPNDNPLQDVEVFLKLNECVWRIETYNINNAIVESNLAIPIFFLDDSVLRKVIGPEGSGNYTLTLENDVLYLDFNFNGLVPFLEYKWEVEPIDFASNILKLNHPGGSGAYMEMHRVCENDEIGFISSDLESGQWRMVSYTDNNLNSLAIPYANDIFIFDIDNTTDEWTINVGSSTGTWFRYIELDEKYLEFNFPIFSEVRHRALNNRWTISSYLNGVINLSLLDSNGLVLENLVFEQQI